MRRQQLLAAAALILGLVMAACGGSGGSGGGSPVTPAAVATGVTVTLSTPIAAGATAQATASATMSNGTTQAVTTGFKSDTPGVATVTDSGLVTGVASGLANIYVVYSGQQGTRNIRVIPNFAGSWSGRYVITNCTQSGAFAAVNACDSFSGSTPPIYASLSQSGEIVSGRMGLGSLVTTSFSTAIGSDGRLLALVRVDDDPSIDCQFNLGSPAPGQVNGNLVQTWRMSGYSGSMVITGSIGTMTKSAGGMTPMSMARPVKGIEAVIAAMKGGGSRN